MVSICWDWLYFIEKLVGSLNRPFDTLWQARGHFSSFLKYRVFHLGRRPWVPRLGSGAWVYRKARERGTHFCGVPLNASKWLAETVATLTPGPKITIPYNTLLFNKIVYTQPTIIELIDRAERYQNTLRRNNRVNTRAALARKLGISKASLTQIMNLLKLAPEMKSYLKKLDDQELLHYNISPKTKVRIWTGSAII